MVEFRLPDCSDHSPGYLVLKMPLFKPPKPFKFFRFWANHPKFMTIVEDSWKQFVSGNPLHKSKVQFIKEGDQNSSFFFRQVAVRQRANSIRVLQDSQGSNLDTFESISGELVRFFSGSLGVVDDNVELVYDDLLKELLGVD
ncbi:hypothetical protein V6N13_097456 [Hibiscus sabdariffa]